MVLRHATGSATLAGTCGILGGVMRATVIIIGRRVGTA
jgi:hypothetical protein